MENSEQHRRNSQEHQLNHYSKGPVMDQQKNTRGNESTGASSGPPQSRNDSDDTAQGEWSQRETPHFLVGSIIKGEHYSETCPAAKTLAAYSETLKTNVIIQIRCKRWGCRHCGTRKVIHYAWRCEDARPNRLVTLTVATRSWENPRAAYEGTKGRVTQLAVRLRRTHGEFEYMKVLEVTKNGWPHYHLIVRSEYIPQQTISNIWADLTGAPIVDVRKLNKSRDVYFYVMKYLAKQKYVPWTTRRVSWTKNFFPPNEHKTPKTLGLIGKGWVDDHPLDVIRRHYLPFMIYQFSTDCWLIPDAPIEDIGKPMTNIRRKKKSGS